MSRHSKKRVSTVSGRSEYFFPEHRVVVEGGSEQVVVEGGSEQVVVEGGSEQVVAVTGYVLRTLHYISLVVEGNAFWCESRLTFVIESPTRVSDPLQRRFICYYYVRV